MDSCTSSACKTKAAPAAHHHAHTDVHSSDHTGCSHSTHAPHTVDASDHVHADTCATDSGHDETTSACSSGQHCCTPADLVPSEKTPAPEGFATLRVRIDAMDCPTEEALIRKQLSAMPEVRHLEFDLLNRLLTVHHENLTPEALQAALRAIGMEPVAAGSSTATPPATRFPWPLVFAAALALTAEIADLAANSVPVWLAPVSALLAVVLCGGTTLRKGWIALRHLTLNIHLLMTIAVAGALALGEWPEAAMVIVLFAVAERIEAASLDKARDAIRALLQQAPDSVRIQDADGQWQVQPAASVTTGSLMLCRPGDRIALDGMIVSGRSALNQAAVTGESLPVEKQTGDTVYAGTLNISAALEIRVTATSADSMLARIADSVQEAQSQRAQSQRMIDRFAAIYTPVVGLIALAIAVIPPLLGELSWQTSLYRALVLLVIACPCALVIAAPVTIVSGLTLAARSGIVIKGGQYLEMARSLKFLALDKTGTLTEGKPKLQQIVCAPDVSEQDALQIAASLEQGSSHPLAHALLSACQQQLLPVKASAVLEEGAIRGIQAQIGGQHYRIGNQAMLSTLSATPDWLTPLQTLSAQGNSLLYLCDTNRLLAVFAVADSIRSNTASALNNLRTMGVETHMLTGDQEGTAQYIAAQAGIAVVHSQLLPDQKATLIAELADKGITAMTGDGINDAPALARAHLGIAMGAGSDIALETADIALMENNLQKIPELIRISARTHRVLWQNIVLALGLKLIVFGLTLSGHGSLWAAVMADTGASVLVVLNGMRILRSRQE